MLLRSTFSTPSSETFFMKNSATLIGLALLSLGGMAQAQSSVTIGGIIDMAGRHTRNSVGSQNSMASGANNTSRLIFRGTEDLGGGLKAGFWLESALQIDTGVAGSSGLLFDRASYLSLGGNWGEVRLGRDYTPGFSAIAATDPFGYVGVAGIANAHNATATTATQRAFGTGVTTFARSNNAVKYLTPKTLGGFYGLAIIAPSENANATGGFRHQAARLGYANADLDISASMASTRIQATGANFKVKNLLGSYKLGPVRVMGGITNTAYLSSESDVMTIGGIWTMGPHDVKAAYARINQKGSNAAGVSINANDANTIGLGYVYNMSKRSVLYATASRISNKGRATFAVPGGVAGAVPGGSSSGYEVGMRHSF